MEPSLESNKYRVEVSGWDACENFFVEKTSLIWGQDGQKQIALKCDLRDGSIIFVRLLQSMPMLSNMPIAYQVSRVARDVNGRTTVSVVQLRPRVGEGSERSDSSIRVA